MEFEYYFSLDISLLLFNLAIRRILFIYYLFNYESILKSVILAKAGIHKPHQYWIPTFVGMTFLLFRVVSIIISIIIYIDV